MTKKQLSSRSTRKSLWKLLIILTLGACILGLFRISNSTSPRISPRISSQFYSGNPKIAFLFLARRHLPLDFLWQTFFENAVFANFSIYIHSEPGFVFDESSTRSSFFYNRQLSNSIKVGWGESSMIQAERLLLGAALEDPANRRFILLSDSCVPLYNFSYIYEYLMTSPKSFVDSFLDKKEGRYNPKMSPVIPKSKWRKGSQWIALVREHAEVVADDEIILPVFRKFCKRRPPVDVSKGKLNSKIQKQHNCIPDEHYVQTLLAMSDLEGELERRTVTYTSWNQSATKMETKGWHPFTFSYANAGPEQMQKIKDINHVYYETEFRTEWCSNNSTLVTCFLFARKFSKGAAMRLLSDGVVGRFDISTLLSNSEP
ncbi:Core-2/I-branching beta-1,6-N-acetylglucosaminyltransferase family protein [Heracleum sosnowskyi]|uniref:Core-2/I-branching beta-1,6-N-acetylglucosaminyltransferase family protein n=1 Tax=Heracleum sosnowskyi TaxID=360622 RepID=A0AAD8I7W8_9APIA|nr:Core-2/I-branching beta-1,6-N-acetylglucosaminyltransferase family protein [Heracleum sosnowskyi]